MVQLNKKYLISKIIDERYRNISVDKINIILNLLNKDNCFIFLDNKHRNAVSLKNNEEFFNLINDLEVSLKDKEKNFLDIYDINPLKLEIKFSFLQNGKQTKL